MRQTVRSDYDSFLDELKDFRDEFPAFFKEGTWERFKSQV